MKINFYANFRTLAGKMHLDISDPGVSTLRELLDHLIELYPEIQPHLLNADDELRPDLPIYVNGRNPRLAEAGLDVRLQPEDEISLFSPIASGRLNVEVLREPTFGTKE